MSTLATVFTLVLGCSGAEPPPAAPSLRLPIDCDIGEDCWISSRPDVDPGPGALDHAGSSHTYDTHSGTDVAVRHVGQAVATWVSAPAVATVLRVREGVPDGQLLAAGLDAVDERECGNAVALDVGGGWEVRICHLLRGSVSVAVGDPLEAGTRVGRVGWSGEADHPHVHLTVVHQGRNVDPFTGRYLDDGTQAAPGPLWAQPLPMPSEIDALAWAGFDAGPGPEGDGWPIDGGRGKVPAWATSLVLGVFLWRPEAGDVVRTEIRRPDGTTTRSEVVQPRDRPRQTWYVEKPWPPDERPVGLWTARVEWQRGDRRKELHVSTVLE